MNKLNHVQKQVLEYHLTNYQPHGCLGACKVIRSGDTMKQGELAMPRHYASLATLWSK